jgi:hypothetical protein
MAFQLKEKNGSLFKNDKKTKETSPDWNGSIMLNGKEYWLSAWEKQGARGQFFSVSIGQEKLPQGFKEAGSDELPKSDPFLDDAPF